MTDAVTQGAAQPTTQLTAEDLVAVRVGRWWQLTLGVICMGYNAQIPRVEQFLGALEEALRAEGWKSA